jgi:hypothetical protein
MPGRIGRTTRDEARGFTGDLEEAGLGAGFVPGFCAGGFFPAVDFCAAGLEALALVVEAGCPPGLVPFTGGLEPFFSAIPVDLTCCGYDSLRRL